MSRVLPALLLGIALALGGVLYFEGGPDQSGTGPGEPNAGRVPELLRPSPRAPAEDPAWVATILDRPLFSPTRRPPTVASAAPAKAATEMPRLAGVLVSEAGSEAIFARSGQRPTVLRVGDQIGPYRVTSISVGEVTLAGPAESVTMHPVFASAAEQPVAAPAGAPPRPRSASPAPVGIPSLAEVQNMITKQQGEAPK
jgi:hypothetical protein